MWKQVLTGAAARALMVVGAVIVVALGLAACGGGSSSSSSAGAGSGSESSESNSSGTDEGAGAEASGETETAEGKTVYFLGCGPETPYCAVQNKEMQKGLEDHGVNAVIQNDGPYDVTIQTKQLNNAIAQKPDLIAGVFTTQQPLRPALMKAQQEDIPVVAFNTPIAEGFEELFAGHVGQDDHNEGLIGGELMAEGLEEAGHNEGRVVILSGAQGDQAAEARNAGFEEGMEKANGNFEITTAYSNWLPTQAASETQQLLAKYDDIVGFFGANSSMAASSIKAAEQAGAEIGGKGGIVYTGGNCDPSAQEYIANGKMKGNDAQSPYTDVETEVGVIVKYLETGELAANTRVPEPVVTKENVDQYEKVCTF